MLKTIFSKTKNKDSIEIKKELKPHEYIIKLDDNKNYLFDSKKVSWKLNDSYDINPVIKFRLNDSSKNIITKMLKSLMPDEKINEYKKFCKSVIQGDSKKMVFIDTDPYLCTIWIWELVEKLSFYKNSVSYLSPDNNKMLIILDEPYENQNGKIIIKSNNRSFYDHGNFIKFIHCNMLNILKYSKEPNNLDIPYDNYIISSSNYLLSNFLLWCCQ